MREILFRGKRIDNGEWVEGCFGQHTSLDALIINRPYQTISGELTALGFYEVDPSTIGQFTGLTDKNGKKIFEGDIVKSDAYFEYTGEYICETVIYKNCGFEITNHGCHLCVETDHNDLEVIGNIHDNPELLEVSNNE